MIDEIAEVEPLVPFQRWLDRAWRRDHEPSPEEAIIGREWRESLWREAAALPEPQREAVALRYSAELSYEQIAQLQGCPIGTFKSRLHQALTALRKAMAPERADDAPRPASCLCDSRMGHDHDS